MYPYEWIENNIYSLSKIGKIEKEIRPVFKEELDYFEMYKVWDYFYFKGWKRTAKIIAKLREKLDPMPPF